MILAMITGVSGETLTPSEFDFLREVRPAGLILFARNCRSHDQIRRLVGDARAATGASDFLVLIDQEGGRVQRLRPPLGRALPPGAAYGQWFKRDAHAAVRAARLAARLVAKDLLDLGINTNCAPVLDVPVSGSHDIIGDRAYGTEPDQVSVLGRAVCEGFLAGGVLPVIKHIPGHGRANADSHFALPVVHCSHCELSATDFAPFKALAEMPAAMTAHVVFTAIDADAPASTSAKVTRDVIRGEIGFGGLLMSDDLSMKALSGAMRERASSVIMAGSDIALHCNGNLAEMQQAAAGVPALEGPALQRFRLALRVMHQIQPFDPEEAELALARVINAAAGHVESV